MDARGRSYPRLGLALLMMSCRQDPAPSRVDPAAANAERSAAQAIVDPVLDPGAGRDASATAFEGHWEGTVGGQRMRSEPERVTMEPHEDTGLFSFGIGCRVPYTISEPGPIEGKASMCVLALRTGGGQEYALMFAQSPDTTITLTDDGVEIELRGVEDDTGAEVHLRLTGRRAQ